MLIKPAENADGSQRKVNLGGWKRQTFDARDKSHSLKLQGALLERPSGVDWRAMCSPPEEQATLGSCTACMAAGMIEFLQLKNSKRKLGAVVHEVDGPSVSVSDVSVSATGAMSFTTTITPGGTAPSPVPAPVGGAFVNVSRLFGYYATRLIQGTVDDDSGASIRDTMKAAAKYGSADELSWAYDIQKFAQKPPDAVWKAAATKKVTSYHAIADGDVETLKTVLASGFLIGFGFEVFSYFMGREMAAKGLLCRPKATEVSQGGHAVALVGFSDTKVMPDGSRGAFLVRNSWGASWGEGGYFWMAENYVGDPRLCSDFWTIQMNPFAAKAAESG